MAFSYPEFHGRKDEDIEDFLEKMEMACISNHVQAPAQMLRLLQICLKGDARAWYKSHEAELQMADPPIQVTWDILRQALTENFVRLEDPDKVWHEIQGLKQQEAEPIDDYIKKFSLLWESLCEALQPQGAPPDMMKKDRFLVGLKENLRWRVELKKPRTYEDTLEVARNKEWKIKRLTQLGVSSLPGVPEMKQANFMQSRGQEEVHHTHCFKLRIDLPGMSKQEVKIIVEDGDLVVSTEHESKEDDDAWSTSSYGSYHIKIKLPDNPGYSLVLIEALLEEGCEAIFWQEEEGYDVENSYLKGLSNDVHSDEVQRYLQKSIQIDEQKPIQIDEGKLIQINEQKPIQGLPYITCDAIPREVINAIEPTEVSDAMESSDLLILPEDMNSSNEGVYSLIAFFMMENLELLPYDLGGVVDSLQVYGPVLLFDHEDSTFFFPEGSYDFDDLHADMYQPYNPKDALESLCNLTLFLCHGI
ncbi:hypothetical protein L7F22_005089 [Adiantum nelumboides]|nr:hypothetical protein [Adiantum nelumboides]